MISQARQVEIANAVQRRLDELIEELTTTDQVADRLRQANCQGACVGRDCPVHRWIMTDPRVTDLLPPNTYVNVGRTTVEVWARDDSGKPTGSVIGLFPTTMPGLIREFIAEFDIYEKHREGLYRREPIIA